MSKFIPKTSTELEWAKQQVMGQTKKSYDEWHNTVINWPHPITGPFQILQGHKEQYERVAAAAEKVADVMTPEERKQFLSENGVF